MNTLPPISDVRKPVPSPMAPSSTITRNSGTDSPKSPIFEQQQHSGEVSDGASSNGPGQHEVHSPQSSLKWSFNNLLNLPQQHRLHNDAKSGTHSEGLSDVPVDTLSHCLRPVLEGLRHLDAEALLELHRVSTTGHTTPTAGVSAARIREGVFVKPIHNDIMPPALDTTNPQQPHNQGQTQRQQKQQQPVRYLHLSEVEGQYSMGIFVFPPHSRIPLHDHPGMCVLSRVLYGDLHRLSLDLARNQDGDEHAKDHVMMEDEKDPERQSWLRSHLTLSGMRKSRARKAKKSFPPGTKRAYKHGVDHLQAPDCTILYPFEGNLHEFVAGPNGAAVLDVLLPPYDVDHHRDCTFYEIQEIDDDHHHHHHDDDMDVDHDDDDEGKEDSVADRAVWIVPTGQPEDFHCISGRYRDLGN